MARLRELVITGSASEYLRGLAPKIRNQIRDKIDLALQDPTPDAKTKKLLRGESLGDGRKVHRLRAGDHRVKYAFDEHRLDVLEVLLRNESTYKGNAGIDVVSIGDLSIQSTPAVPPATAPTEPAVPGTVRPKAGPRQSSEPLPAPLTAELLLAAGCPEAEVASLVKVADVDALLTFEGVNQSVLMEILDRLIPTEAALDRDVLLRVGDTQTLDRLLDGEIDPIDLLLALDGRQLDAVSFAMNGGGPVLVRGGPGTGKSTVAMYRVREFLNEVRSAGIDEPRILFTSYTHALAASSRVQLSRLLGTDSEAVTVQTTDSVIDALYEDVFGGRPNRVNDLGPWVIRVLDELPAGAEGDRFRRLVDRLGASYVGEEIDEVIYGRDLRTLDAYRASDRAGRRVPLSRAEGGQRDQLWSLKTALEAFLQRKKQMSYGQVRAVTASAAAATEISEPMRYDAIVVDEAQDLAPVALAALLSLVESSNRLFVAADANQSIFRAGVDLTAAHPSLDFTGRVRRLDVNYRSTRAIETAASSYLMKSAEIVDEVGAVVHDRDGEMPQRIRVGPGDVALTIADRLMDGSRRHRVPVGSAAVFCPTNSTCRDLATALNEIGLPAKFFDSRGFDPEANQIKVMPMAACKGLEFPLVAVAGLGSGDFPRFASDLAEDAVLEAYERARRLVYVAMTRAMFELTVVVPQHSDDSLVHGFDDEHWMTVEIDT